MNEEEYLRVLEQWLKQLQADSPTPALTQSIATQAILRPSTGLRQLSEDLASDMDDPEVEAWLQAALADAIPVPTVYPKLDLSFFTTPNWSADVVSAAVEQGKQWVLDQMGAVYILFGQLLRGEQAAVWAVRSGDTDQPIFHRSFNDEQLGWEIEISAFAETEVSCHVEISIFRPEKPDADLAGVPILLRVGDEPAQTQTTDIGGVVEFAGIPRAKLDQVVVRIVPTN